MASSKSTKVKVCRSERHCFCCMGFVGPDLFSVCCHCSVVGNKREKTNDSKDQNAGYNQREPSVTR